MAALQHAGVHAGDIVLISLPNGANNIIALYATLALHAVAYTVNPTMPLPELATLIGRHHYGALILGPDHAENSAELATRAHVQLSTSIDDSTAATPVLAISHQPVPTNTLLHDFAQHNPSPVGVLMYTSGTTGDPKAVVLTHGQLFAAAQDVATSQQLTALDRTLVVLPLFHINAQVISVLATTISGGKLVVAQKFSAHRFWRWVQDERITWLSGAPAIIAILLKTRPAQQPAVPTLRFIRSASAPLLPHIQQDFEDYFHVPIIQGYGMTEAASQITVNPLAHPQVGSVGRPTDTDLVILDDNDAPQPAGVTGEIALHGDHVITSYLDPKYQADFRHGWFHTGDVGYLNDEGYLFIVGRKKELINHGGNKISPAEIENVLTQHPAVNQVAVVGLPDDIYGEAVTAAVVLNPGFTGEDTSTEQLRTFATSRLSKFKVPSRFVYVDSLAAGPTGKIQHTRVKRALMAATAH
ncbi:AMP-binding protein [Lacticaseibacillus thailandensis]|uniref:AMP-binding protein n=1 Tax=Lacticaseibacillus thailandensis TaxID=381741 RepID=UPI0006D08432|nr:AMP-binding protein [Lacticaseibacillus thailandensis]